MSEKVQPYLEVAIQRRKLDEALRIVGAMDRAVFGTMDGRVLDRLGPAAAGAPVYFYEPG